MHDEDLIMLFEQRSEQAIELLEQRYGRYCRTIAGNILRNAADTEECCYDAFFAVWKAIPPAKPTHFKGWLAAIVRNAALRKMQQNLTAEELKQELLSDFSDGSLAEALEAKELAEAISSFLHQEKAAARTAFLRRYWYTDSIESISLQMGWSISKTKSILFRTRKRLKEYLKKEELWYDQ